MAGEEQYSDLGVLSNALRKGNEKAFEYVFQENYALLLNYASRIIYDPETARDLVQEVFCHLWDKHTELQITVSLRAYLFKLVYTACIDSIRHKKVEARFADKTLQDFYFNEIIQTPEAELELLNSDFRKLILKATEKLPEKCRRIFLMCKMEGKSYNETATKLHISIKTVESQMTIAFARLRKELEWLLLLIIIIY